MTQKKKENTVLITGGTGSLGQALTKHLLDNNMAKKIIVYSRDEYKQKIMWAKFGNDAPIRYIIGDVRKEKELERAMTGVDIVFHCAALKQVDVGEYNPTEFIHTNIGGAESVIEAAGKSHVQRVVAISTDKACFPINLYGKTKSVMDSLIINANALYPSTRFTLVRYGNVAGSRGSVIPFFREKKERKLPLTDKRMTRFWITLDEGVELIMTALEEMQGGETFIAKMPSFRVVDLISSFGKEYKVVGLRPGEKIHETVITEYDRAYDNGDYYIVHPTYPPREIKEKGTMMPMGFSYSSDNNRYWLSVEDLKEKLEGV